MNASLGVIASGLIRRNITMSRCSVRVVVLMAWCRAECSYERGGEG
jgi:hypothetical protein